MFFETRIDGGELLLVGPRGQDIASVLHEARKNSSYLRRGLPFSQDHFGHAGTQSTMMIDFGEAEIFKGQMPEAIDGGVRSKRPAADLLEKFADGVGVQGAAQHSASTFSQ